MGNISDFRELLPAGGGERGGVSGQIRYKSHCHGWALKISSFWAQMALASLVAISGPTPSNSPCNGFIYIYLLKAQGLGVFYNFFTGLKKKYEYE